jgi:glutamate N-acetyltransferase/amino-acid N-acetyltransferase
VPFDPAQATLHIQPGEETALAPDAVRLFAGGVPTAYQETDAAAVMNKASITALLDCGAGDGTATVWTCDLSYDYVKINGDYRT